MGKYRKSILSIIVCVITAFTMVMGVSLVLREDNTKGTTPDKLESAVQLAGQSEFDAWLANPSTNIKLTQDVNYGSVYSGRSISGQLDGDGHTITFTGSGEAFSGGDKNMGAFSAQMTSGAKISNVVFNFVNHQQITIAKGARWSLGTVNIGIVTGELQAGAVIDNVTFNMNHSMFFWGETPGWSLSQNTATKVLAGVLAGYVAGEIRNSTVNANAEFRVECTSTNGNSGNKDTTWAGFICGELSGKLINNTVNVGTVLNANSPKALIHSDGTGGEVATLIAAGTHTVSSVPVINGVMIKGVKNLTGSGVQKISANGNSQSYITADYAHGEITNIYSDGDLGAYTNVTAWGNNNELKPNSAKITDEMYFKAGDNDNIYIKHSSLIWSINGVDAFNNYDSTDGSVHVAKWNATAKNQVPTIENGTFGSGAEVSFATDTIVYGDAVPSTVAKVNGSVLVGAEYQVTTDVPAGIMGVGNYKITSVSNIIDKANRILYRDSAYVSSFAVTPRDINVTSSIDNVYNSTLTFSNLINDEKVNLGSVQQGNGAVSLTNAGEWGIELPNSNYKFADGVSTTYTVGTKVITKDARITLVDAVDGVVDNGTDLTISKKVDILKLQSVSLYGVKINGIDGASSSITESTNSKIVADVTLNVDVVELTINETVRTISVNATATAGGSASVDNATPTISEMITFTATADEGNIFLGWKDTSGKYVSFDATYTTYASVNDITLTAQFNTSYNVEVLNGNRLMGKLQVADTSKLLLGKILTTEEAGLDTAIESVVGGQAYNTFKGWYVASLTDGIYTLKPAYAESTTRVMVSMDGTETEYGVNDSITLAEGSYTVNGVAITVSEGKALTLKAINGLTIVTNGVASATESATGSYDAQANLIQINAIYGGEKAVITVEIYGDDALMATSTVSGRLVTSNGVNVVQSFKTIDTDMFNYANQLTAKVSVNGNVIGIIALN